MKVTEGITDFEGRLALRSNEPEDDRGVGLSSDERKTLLHQQVR
jgi:hypothetical protein